MSGELITLDGLLSDASVHKAEFTYRTRERYGWSCDIEHDRVTFSGQADTPEEAFVEALVDRSIGDFYYYGDTQGPRLTQEQMTEMRQHAYVHLLGVEADGEYRGEYLKETHGRT